jgi:hypothetical protein
MNLPIKNVRLLGYKAFVERLEDMNRPNPDENLEDI